ncbi:hypothetical protein HPULCUR_007754 [Helicostylum pulchrum]|uniref:Uncharacterized protein n=1 Tax=Helicostylum pulchrum TaxID=562976 RepID=A0ABP9Y5N5_9FUNG
MYKVSLNSRINKQRLAQANRAMSTGSNTRPGGMNKLLVGGILASAASYVYYQRYKKDNDFYHGDSEPYSKTKHQVQSKSNDALQELNYAGDRIKKSAEDVADTARDTFSTVKKEGKETIRNLKDESESFLANHHLKEGDRRPEKVLSSDSNQAAFNAAHKSEQAKGDIQHNPMVDEKISSNKTKSASEAKLEDHAQRDVRDTTPLVSKDTDKVKPVWNDNNNNNKSNVETDINTALEESKSSVLDTTISLGKEIKSTVYSIFGNHEPAQRTNSKNGRDSWESRLGAENVIATRTDQDIIDATRNLPVPGKKGTSYDFYGVAETAGNPMVTEKLNTNKTKPLWETSLEEHAQEVVRDTSILVDKDTQKVRQGVWDAKNLANEKTSGSISYKDPAPSFWSTWFGGGKSETEAHRLEQEAEDKWGDLKNKAEVTKNDVKQTASQSWQDAKHKAEAESGRVKKDVDSTVNDLSNKSKQEASRLESGWNSLKNEVSNDAEYVLHKAEDTASSVAGKFKNETNKLESEAERAAREAKNEGSRITRHASDEVARKAEEAKEESARLARRASNEVAHKAEEVKDKGVRLTRRASDEVANKTEEAKEESARLARRASDTIYSKAEDVREKAEDVKEKAEDSAKSWYRAGTEQVKSGINTVKNVADQDIHWAEEKVHDGVEGIKETLTEAKEEVDRLFGERRDQGYKGHVVRGEKFAEDEAGQLRATRDNVALKPAEVVVEEAHSHDM